MTAQVKSGIVIVHIDDGSDFRQMAEFYEGFLAWLSTQGKVTSYKVTRNEKTSTLSSSVPKDVQILIL